MSCEDVAVRTQPGWDGSAWRCAPTQLPSVRYRWRQDTSPPGTSRLHHLSSILKPWRSLGHYRWFRNLFPPFSPVFHCPLGLGKLQACPVPYVVFSPPPLSALTSSPFHCLVRWFWPDLMNGIYDHTTAICVSLRWLGGLHVVRLPAGSWRGLPRW